MKKRCLLAVPILAATAFAAQQPNAIPSSQSPSARPTPAPKQIAPPPPVPTARPMPADQKAYTEGSRIKDPQKKIEALEKFLEQHPDSQMTAQAHLDILDALIKSQPESKDKILAHAEEATQKALSPASSSSNAYAIASRLMKAGMLAEAEQYAQKAIASAEEHIAQMLKDVQRMKSRPLGVLGLVYLKQNKLKEAEQKLKAAFAIYPAEADVAASLAEIAEKSGKETEAMDYLLAARRLKAPDRQKLETLWRKSHGGSLDGLEEELDARYHKGYSGLVPVTRYQPTGKRSSRAVLAEVFTGAACGSCLASDLGFEAMMERYSRQELIVLMYHQHIPAPDPMTNPASEARFEYYGGVGVPSYTIDGLPPQSGGGGKDLARAFYQRVNPLIEKRLEVAAEASLKLDASLEDGVVKVTAHVALNAGAMEKVNAEPKPTVETKNGMASPRTQLDAEPSYKLHVLLVEETLRYQGENGIRIHPMVVRAMGGFKAGGFALDPAKLSAANGEPVNASFDIAAISEALKKNTEDFETARSKDRDEPFTFIERKHEINVNNLSVVAFVQDQKSKKALQTATVRLNSKGVAMK
jgi:tetratricopeptide (TPR) repeat protein